MTTAANLTKRDYFAIQIFSVLLTFEDLREEYALEQSVEYADKLISRLSGGVEQDGDTLPDPSWDYATLWGLLCTTEARVKGLKQHLSQFEEGSKEIDEQTYHQLMGILESVNGAMSCINVRPRKNTHN